MMAVRISRRRVTNWAQNPKSQRSAVRRLGARRRERCRTRSCCFKRIFSARTDRVPPVPRRTASLASRCTITKIAFFMDKQFAQHRTQEQGSRIAAAAHLNYEFAMFTVVVDWIDAVNKDIADREVILEEVLREMRTQREELDKLGLEPRKLRRRLRRALARPGENGNKDKLRRGAEARQAFRAAEKIATLALSPVFPKHLLHGIAVAGSETLLGLLKEMGFETEPILKAEAWAGQKLGTTIQGGGAVLN